MTQSDPTPRPDEASLAGQGDGVAAEPAPVADVEATDAMNASVKPDVEVREEAEPAASSAADDSAAPGTSGDEQISASTEHAAVEVEMQGDHVPEQAAVRTAAEPAVGTSGTADEEAPIDPAVAQALQGASGTTAAPLKSGQKLKARIVQIGDTDCFLDFGGRSEGVLAASEIRDAQGAVKHKVGDELDVVVKQVGEQVIFSLGRKGPPPILGKLQQAFEAGATVQGLIRKTNKGGFDVSLRGARAFCPMSQIELGHCANPEQYVGQKLPFAIITFERGGRNIVVSRRKLLEAEAKEASARTRERLAVGEVFQGTVRRIQPYGAFVDLGGIDGLLHVSEISRARIASPSDLLSVGQTIQVKVIRIEGQETDKERISLSMKELEPDPWSGIEEHLREGETAKGKVVRLTDFGAFVQLEAGVDGLIHISEISPQRIGHPRDVLAVGQDIEARVLRVDAQRQRVSLSLRSNEDDGDMQPPPTYVPRMPREREGRSRREMHQNEGPRRREAPPAPSLAEPDGGSMDYDEKLEALKRKFNVRA